MKKKVIKVRNFLFPDLMVVVLFLLPNVVHAAVHVVLFGGSLGLVYSPSSFSAVVGDTVRWNGDFTMHPLSSTTIPAGAATWHVTSGSTFDYVAGVAGTYNYRCDTHFGLGMTGTFTSTVNAVLPVTGISENNAQVTVSMISPGRHPVIQLDMRTGGFIYIALFSLSGEKKTILVSALLDAGSHSIPVMDIGPGMYLVRVVFAGQEVFRKLVIPG